jgi:hypothetical protein
MVRLKTRYVLMEVVSPAASARKLVMQKDDVAGLIRESIARNYGDYGVGLLQYAFQGAACVYVRLCVMAMLLEGSALLTCIYAFMGCMGVCAYLMTSSLFQQVHALCGRAVRTRAVQAGRVIARVCDRMPEPRRASARRTRLRYVPTAQSCSICKALSL